LDDILLVSEPEAFSMCRRLAREEGVLVGISSGAAVHAALQIAAGSDEDPVIVCILADTGQRYLSVEGLF
jgi:cysteine synthase